MGPDGGARRCSVLCWARNQEISDDINLRHLNSKYLPNIPLPSTIRATSSLSDVLILPIRFY
ncbi:MAG: hypothetical protein ACLSHR_11615 [Oscillospiraceae bacterium]